MDLSLHYLSVLFSLFTHLSLPHHNEPGNKTILYSQKYQVKPCEKTHNSCKIKASGTDGNEAVIQ